MYPKKKAQSLLTRIYGAFLEEWCFEEKQYTFVQKRRNENFSIFKNLHDCINVQPTTYPFRIWIKSRIPESEFMFPRRFDLENSFIYVYSESK